MYPFAKTAPTPVVPVVGMGATYGEGSDSYPATVIAVSASGKSITVQADEHMITKGDGLGNGDYVTLPNPDGATRVYTLRKNGRWMAKGVPVSARYGYLSLGVRRYYQDPSF